jgi:hypothetical protein
MSMHSRLTRVERDVEPLRSPACGRCGGLHVNDLERLCTWAAQRAQGTPRACCTCACCAWEPAIVAAYQRAHGAA